MGQFLVTNRFEISKLNKEDKKNCFLFGDHSLNFLINFKNKNKNKNEKFNTVSASLKSKKHCLKLTKTVFNEIYYQQQKFYNFNISKNAYGILLIPLLNNFIEIFYNKYFELNKIIKKRPDLYLSTLNKKDFIFFNTFAEFLSYSQKDFFNFQIATEIINFNNYTNKKKQISNKFIKRIFKKIFIILDKKKISKSISLNNFSRKNIDNYIGIYKVDFRHANFLKKFFKTGGPQKKNINLPILNKIKLKYLEGDNKLRNIISKKLKGKNNIEKFIFEMCIKYLPTLYLESVKNNFYNLDKQIKSVPKLLLSNAHGWWTDDKFKFYAGFCILNKTKYIDIQHNGTYFIIKKNPHYEISKYFRNYFIGWGSACERDKSNIKLPPLYSISKKKKKIKKNNSKKIIFMGASIKRFFGGYFQSYLSGGNSFFYYKNQYNFLKNLSNSTKKKIILRLRHAEKDPRRYVDFIKKNFSDIKFEDIKIPASERLDKSDVGIVVVDHCSTPWLEVLFSNKPLIIFWSNKENIINSEYKTLINSLKKRQIYFDCPIAAAKRLEELIKKQNYDWWYKDTKIQNLRKKILKLFFYSNSKPIRSWKDGISKIFYESR